MEENAVGYVLSMLGLAILAGLSIHGTAEAATLVITSTTMHVRKRNVLIASYITSSFSTTIFLFGFIISCVVISGMKAAISLAEGFANFVACLVYGVAAYVGGSAMGSICKTAFPLLAVERRFFLLFFLMVTIVEVMLVFAFVMALMR